MIVGAVVGILVLALVAWQVISPALAASRPASPVTTTVDAAATVRWRHPLPAPLPQPRPTAQLALANRVLQTATAAAESTVQAVSVANTAVAVGEATSQALSTAAADTENAKATEQALTLAQATDRCGRNSDRTGRHRGRDRDESGDRNE